MGYAGAPVRRSSAVIAGVLLALALPPPAIADRGGGPGSSGGGPNPSGGGPIPGGGQPSRGGGARVTQVRAAGACGRGARSELRLKQDDSGIEVEFDAHDGGGRQESWQVILVQEGRVVWRAQIRTHGDAKSWSARHTIGVLGGADRITARATGPRGITCVASALLPG